jgi:hypothetical protein
MTKHNIGRLIVAFVILVGFAFAVINNGGTDYTEALMPLSQGGSANYYYVVMGSNITVTCSGNRDVFNFTVNGTDYVGANNASVPASADDRYYIYYSGKKSTGAFTVSGTNDWTTQTYTPVSAPFSQSGAGSYFYSTSDPIDSVITTNMDFFLINNADYSNSTVTNLPAKINGNYYFYYGTTSASGTLDIKDYSPKLNVKVFIEGGL